MADLGSMAMTVKGLRQARMGKMGRSTMNLLKFQLAPVKQDGIIEPGCRVLVSSIEIRNVGWMPLRMASEGYDRFVQLPPGLKPSVTVVVQCATFNRKADERIAPKMNAPGEYLAFCIAPVDPVLALSTFPVGTSSVKRSGSPHPSHLRSGYR